MVFCDGIQVECPKFPGFCITRQKNNYPFIEIFHSPEQVGVQSIPSEFVLSLSCLSCVYCMPLDTPKNLLFWKVLTIQLVAFLSTH